jgi:transposase-like protein
MRNIREKGRKRDREELKQWPRLFNKATDRKKARAAFRCFKLRWQTEYPTMVNQLDKDLRRTVSVFSSPNVSGSNAHHQYYRPLFCGSTTSDATDGLLQMCKALTELLFDLQSL